MAQHWDVPEDEEVRFSAALAAEAPAFEPLALAECLVECPAEHLGDSVLAPEGETRHAVAHHPVGDGLDDSADEVAGLVYMDEGVHDWVLGAAEEPLVACDPRFEDVCLRRSVPAQTDEGENAVDDNAEPQSHALPEAGRD